MQTPRRVFDLLQYQLEHFPKADAFAQKVGAEWKSYSTAESLEIIAALAWGLHSLGIRRGDRVANVAETNRPEWNFIEWGKKRRPIPVSAIRLVQAKTCLLCAARSFPS